MALLLAAEEWGCLRLRTRRTIDELSGRGVDPQGGRIRFAVPNLSTVFNSVVCLVHFHLLSFRAAPA